MKKNILLVCGSGLSSGFMAQSIRKAAKQQGIEMSVTARSEAEALDLMDSIDMLLIGPHMKHLLVELEDHAEPYNVPVRVIDEKAYGEVNGAAVLKTIIETVGN